MSAGLCDTLKDISTVTTSPEMEESVKRSKTWQELKDQYGGLDMKLAENHVEYALLVLPQNEEGSARKQLALLETIRKTALELAASLTKDFIWQRDEFNLNLKNDHGGLPFANELLMMPS